MFPADDDSDIEVTFSGTRDQVQAAFDLTSNNLEGNDEVTSTQTGVSEVMGNAGKKIDRFFCSKFIAYPMFHISLSLNFVNTFHFHVALLDFLSVT